MSSARKSQLRYLVRLRLTATCCVATAQTDRPPGTSQPIATAQTDRVLGDLAVLTSHLEKTTYKRGDPIRVAIVLTAGPKGAYFPAYFADFNGTCAYGFAATILTDKGTSADPSVCLSRPFFSAAPL